MYSHWQVRKLEEQLTDLTDKHESTEKKQVKMKEQNAQLIERYALMTSQRASHYILFMAVNIAMLKIHCYTTLYIFNK